MKKMSGKEFKEIVSKSIHHNCPITYETIILDLCVYSIYKSDECKRQGLKLTAKHYEDASIMLKEELEKRNLL